jgi:hypothetical protein
MHQAHRLVGVAAGRAGDAGERSRNNIPGSVAATREGRQWLCARRTAILTVVAYIWIVFCFPSILARADWYAGGCPTVVPHDRIACSAMISDVGAVVLAPAGG